MYTEVYDFFHSLNKIFEVSIFFIFSPHLTSIDRMGLFDDQVAMVLCEETGDTVRILRMAQTFREYERSITVWRSVLGILHQIRTLTWSKSTNHGRPASSDGASLLADRYDTFIKSIYKVSLYII